MRLLAFVFVLFSVSSVHASAVSTDLSGTYIGCGYSKSFGGRQVIFNLVKLPTGFQESEYQYAVAFSLYGGSAIYFPEIQFNADGTKMFMRTEIRPSREYGLIINTVTVEILPDGSLSGLYETNSMNSEGYLLKGIWTAKKVDAQKNP